LKVIMAGSRSLADFGLVLEGIKTFPYQITEIVSGGSRGIDLLGEDWAKQMKLPKTRFTANWKRFGQAAGPLRNSDMSEYADALIAIWDGKSKGTEDLIRKMQRREKVVHLLEYVDADPEP